MSSEVTRLLLVVAIMGAIAAGVFVVADPIPGDDEAPGSNVTTAPDSNTTETPDSGESSVCVVFFYSPTCPHCQNVEEYFETVPEKDITVQKHRASESGELWRQYLEAYDVPKDEWGSVPTVFVGDEYAIGDDPSIDLIESKLESNESVECRSVD